MNISLTKELEAYVKEKVRSGLYHDASEVVRESLRRSWEEDQMEPEWLENKIREGLSSPSHPVTEATWSRIERRGRAKLARIRKKAA